MRRVIDNFKNYGYESFVLLLIFVMTWLGFGRYMAAVILLAFLFDLLFREKRRELFSDRVFLYILLAFVFFSVISSLFSIDRLKSTLLSLLWFLVVFVPVSYVKFSLDGDINKDFFAKVIVPVSFVISLFIVGWLVYKFTAYSLKHGIVFRRYTFIWLGKATTPDTLVMLTGIGYAFLRSQKIRGAEWISFIYLLVMGFGFILTYDRGGVVSFFIISILLLSTDYKRLIVYILLIAAVVFLSFKVKYLAGVRHFFDFIYSPKIQKALNNRQQLDTFHTAWQIIKDHWFLGVGTNNFSKFTKRYGSGHWYAYAHNFILQFWAENGVLGLVSALTLIGLTFKRWFYTLGNIDIKRKVYVFGVGVSFIGMLIGNLTNSTIWIIKIALPFWMLVGIINGYYMVVIKRERY